jgi:DNA-binding CsgD family transcriptional regulator
MAPVTTLRRQVRRDLVRLAHRNHDVRSFSRAAVRIITKAVPCEGTCLLTLDPATLLPTGDVVDNGLPAEVMPRYIEIELREPDLNKFASLARRPEPAASLSGVTGGDLDRSLRQREIRRPNGYGDELRVTLATDMGTWGAVTLMREAGRPHFSAADVRFMASLSIPLAEGLRSASMAPAHGAGDDAGRDGAGIIVVGPDGTIEMADRGADRWLDELGAGRPGAELPRVIHVVVNAARRTVADNTIGERPGDDFARARVRTGTGRWAVVRGSLLGEGPASPVAVLIERARPPELAPLIADAYGFTERERRVVELVAQGFATSEIAGQLQLSAYTVQDHLKSIFDKSGTGSRGDLVARLFFDHYRPRLTDTGKEE